MYPLVSIVFTSYNHKEFLKQALDSLINQTYPNLEIIIIDDCSTDGSQEILKEYQHHYHVDLKLSDKNSGSYVKASNLGASFAKGDFLLFAQCDDFADPNQIEDLMKAFHNEKVGVSFCMSNLVDENGNFLGNDFDIREISFRKRLNKGGIASRQQMRLFLSKSCVIPNLSAAIVRRELYIKSGGLSTQYLVAADWAFWLTLAELCDFSYTAKPLNNFRQHNTTIRSTTKIKRQILEIYQIFYHHIKKYDIRYKEKESFKIGAGAVWLSYVGQGYKAWLLSFPGLLKETFRYEKLNLFYLLAGLFYKIKEVVRRR